MKEKIAEYIYILFVFIYHKLFNTIYGLISTLSEAYNYTNVIKFKELSQDKAQTDSDKYIALLNPSSGQTFHITINKNQYVIIYIK